MKILFDKKTSEATQGAAELQRLTGGYYANNNFDRIKLILKLETEKLIETISPEVYAIAEEYYFSNPTEANEKKADLVEHIQLAIGLAGTHRFYQGNLVSHEDTGRKTKIDKENESLPWEWMIDRDDQANERNSFDAVDRLIRFLDKSEMPEWINSPAQKSTRNLFINNTTAFDRVYPIDKSGRFYYAVVPFLDEIQRNKIRKALGNTKYAQVLAWHKQPGEDTSTPAALENSIIISFIQQAMPLLAMEMAVKRFTVNILPFSVVQQFKSLMQTRNASQAALDATIERFLYPLKKDAADTLDELKIYLNANDPDAIDYDLLPDNPEYQKFFRT